jgi:hypothetical protein
MALQVDGMCNHTNSNNVGDTWLVAKGGETPPLRVICCSLLGNWYNLLGDRYY